MMPRISGEHRVIAERWLGGLLQSGTMMRLVAAVLLATTATAVAAPPGETPLSQPQAPPPETSERVPAVAPSAALPRLPPCDPAPRPPERGSARSILLETVVGGALGIGGLYGGGYLGYKLECANGCPGEFGGLGGILVGAALGLTITATAGVMIVGNDDDHRSSIGLTWLGTVLGGVAGGYAAAKLTGENIVGSTVVLATGTALGGALMFHATRTRKATGLQLVPFAGDGSVGLSLVGAVR
jgi:hypothetical protein